MATRRASNGGGGAAAGAAGEAPRKLSTRQRLALVIGTGLAAGDLVAMDDGDFTYDFFLDNGVKAPLLKAANILPVQLKARGATTPSLFRSLGFSSLDLVEATFCAQCVAAYGAPELLKEFVVTANDAVILAGSPAADQLGLDPGTMLVLCCGEPDLAGEVLTELRTRRAGAVVSLAAVAPLTILDTGLRARRLRELGYTPELLVAQTKATAGDLAKLGF